MLSAYLWLVLMLQLPGIRKAPQLAEPKFNVLNDPKFTKRYSALIDQELVIAHSAPAPAVQPTLVAIPVAESEFPAGVGQPLLQNESIVLMEPNAAPAWRKEATD